MKFSQEIEYYDGRNHSYSLHDAMENTLCSESAASTQDELWTSLCERQVMNKLECDYDMRSAIKMNNFKENGIDS